LITCSYNSSLNPRGRGAATARRVAEERRVKGHTGKRARKKIVQKRENQFVEKKNLLFCAL